MVSTGGNDPDFLKKTAISAINEILKAITVYHSLKYANDKLNVIDKNVKMSENALLELWQWTNSSMFEINNAVNNLINQVAGINSCHCMDEGGLHDQLTALDGLVNNLDGYITSTINPEIQNIWQSFSRFSTRVWGANAEQLMAPLDKIETVYTASRLPLIVELSKIWAPLNESDDDKHKYEIADPSQEIKKLSIPLTDDPYERPFDESKPVYGKMNIPYDLQVNGLINGVDINDLKPVESNFRPFSGYEYYYIENDDVYTDDYIYNSIECKKLGIKNIPSTTINKLKTIKNK